MADRCRETYNKAMRVCIHQGTQEIGGTCIEVEAEGKRIVLDVGLPLDAGEFDDGELLLPRVNGFKKPDEVFSLL